AETELVLQGAKNKRVAKRVDMIAANLVGAGHGFDVDENALHVIWENGECELPRTGKTRLAAQLVSLVADQLDSNNTHDKVISINAKDSA
ncbi:MAG: hypothetical protein OEX75_09470, partial [Gammaproteobacteria bacterium]|nr:hypothetical protein [Gammaproteobacteria bacterium]